MTDPARTGTPPAEASAAFATVGPDGLTWREIPGGLGAQAATLFGDPGRPGLYVVRVRFPPHTMDTPHSHTADRYVTVLEGDWRIGVGPDFDPASAGVLSPGSVMFHPAGGVHWDGSASDAAVVVQVVGLGPVQTLPHDPDAPRWVRVAAP